MTVGNYSNWDEIYKFVDQCSRNVGSLSVKNQAHRELQKKFVLAGCKSERKVSTAADSRLGRGSIDIVYKNKVAIEFAFSSIDEIFRDLCAIART